MNGVVYILKLNTIHQGDCLEVMKEIPDDSFSLIIVDPPYHKIIKEKWDNEHKTHDEYLNWLGECISEFKRITKPNGTIYVWNTWQNTFDVRNIALRNGLFVRNCITWNRGGGKERNNWGNQKECLLYLSLSENPVFNLEDVLIEQGDPVRKMSKSSWERCKYERKGRKTKVNPSNVWTDPFIRSNSQEYIGHPTQKPLTICDRIVKASSEEFDSVFIPFGGSGSEVISCIKNKRNFVAVEKELDYVEMINARIKRFTDATSNKK